MESEGLYIHRRLFTLALHTPKNYFLFFFDYFPYTRTKRKKHFFDYSGGTGFANCCCFWYFNIASPWTEGNWGRTNAAIAGNLRSLFVQLIDANFFKISNLRNELFWSNSQDLALWISWIRFNLFFNFSHFFPLKNFFNHRTKFFRNLPLVTIKKKRFRTRQNDERVKWLWLLHLFAHTKKCTLNQSVNEEQKYFCVMSFILARRKTSIESTEAFSATFRSSMMIQLKCETKLFN